MGLRGKAVAIMASTRIRFSLGVSQGFSLYTGLCACVSLVLRRSAFLPAGTCSNRHAPKGN